MTKGRLGLARRMGLAGRLAADRRGATAVEFALVAPLLLALLFGSVETGRYLWFAAVLDHAVGEAARCPEVVGAGCATPDVFRGRMEERLARLAGSSPGRDPAMVMRPATCGTEVRVSLPYPSLVPGLGPALPALSASACIGQAA